MYAIGTDSIATGTAGPVPTGPAHAVDLDGLVLCRAARPRFHFPALRWQQLAENGGQLCAMCAAVALERALPPQAGHDYPEQPAAQPAVQPAVQQAVQVSMEPALTWASTLDLSTWSQDLRL
jgi:hypothetical protein